MNNIDNAYTDLNNLISINADEIRTNNLYVDGILILPSSTNFNNINCQTLTCQTDLSSNTLYATVSIQGVPVAKFAFLDATSSIQGQFNNIITNYVSNSSLTSTLANYVSLAGAQAISGAKTFTSLIKNTSSYYFSADGTQSIYCTPGANPATTGNTTYMRQYASGGNCYYDYGNGSLFLRTTNAATGLPTGQQFEFSSAGWFLCYAISCASIFNFSYIDFRSITSPSTNFLINNNTIPLLAVIGLQTALDSKLSTTTAASTYLTIANAASTYLTQTNAASTYLTITNASSTYLTQTNAASTYLTITNAGSTYATIASLSNYLTTSVASSTYLTIIDASNNYVKNTTLTSTLTNYLTTSTAASTYATIVSLSNYLTSTTAASTYLTIIDASNNYVKTTSLANYVTLTGTQTISGQKSFTSFIKNTSAYYFSADGATTSSIYCTPNANPAQAGNNAYMRQFAASSTGNCYYDYANSIIFRNANATNGNTTGYEISFSPTGSIVCGALYTAIISSFSYIDFRSITTPSTNMLFNNNMINKSVIIGLTGDLSTITTNISNLDTRVTADEVVIAANTTAIAGLVTTTTTHSTQIAALTTSVGVLQGQMTTAESNITALQAKTAYQSVVSTSTQFTNNLKMMNGLNYTILLNGTTGDADFYGLMTIYNNLNVNGVAGGSGGTISSTNITGSAITANTTLSSGGTLSVTGSSTLNATTLTTGNLVISSGSLTISSALGTNTFNNSCSFTNGLISTNLVSNSLNYKDAVVNIGNTANIYTTGGSALSFNTLNIGNLTTNVNINGIVTLTGLTYFNGPSFNMSSYINQL